MIRSVTTRVTSLAKGLLSVILALSLLGVPHIAWGTLAGTVIWEIQNGGSDSANGGAFDPGQTSGMFTDGAATVANTTAPVFTSASYNFVAGDVGAYVFIGVTGGATAWTLGWYKISSVASNAATLDATVGHYVRWVNSTQYLSSAANESSGCAAGASPTACTWSIDYSQQPAVAYTFAHLTTAGSGLVLTGGVGGDHAFGKQDVGNSLDITGGTNFTAGRYVIASVAAGAATVVGPGNVATGVGASGTGGEGGALSTVATAWSVAIASNRLWLLYNASAFTQSAAPTLNPANVSNVTNAVNPTRLTGYNTYRGDIVVNGLTRPTLQLATNTGLTAFAFGTKGGFWLEHIIIDGNSLGTSTGVSGSGNGILLRDTKIINCTSNGVSLTGGNATLISCEVASCTSAAASGVTLSTAVNGVIQGCYIHDNVCPGVILSLSTGAVVSFLNNIVYNNTGASSDGLQTTFAATVCNNLFYGNGRDNIRMTSTTLKMLTIKNNLLLKPGSSGYNLNFSGGAAWADDGWDFNFYWLSTGTGNRNQCGNGLNDVVLTADPITSAGTNFALNATANAGAAARSVGFPNIWPGLASTAGYTDGGPVRHIDPTAGVPGRGRRINGH